MRLMRSDTHQVRLHSCSTIPQTGCTSMRLVLAMPAGKLQPEVVRQSKGIMLLKRGVELSALLDFSEKVHVAVQGQSDEHPAVPA
jgi:hypothetical protein